MVRIGVKTLVLTLCASCAPRLPEKGEVGGRVARAPTGQVPAAPGSAPKDEREAPVSVEVPEVEPPSAPAARTAPSAQPSPGVDGTFSCGSKSLGFAYCKREAQTCCLNDNACQPRGAETEACWARAECNTSADCGSGESCCRVPDFGQPPGATYYRRCSSERCAEAEVCRPGSCPSGQRCLGYDAGVEAPAGWCGNGSAAVQCGATVCRGETPTCRWDGTTGECVGPEEISGYTCDDDGDCLKGERCWLGVGGTSACCRGESCFAHAATSKWTPCKSARDCPQLEGFVFDCVADPDLLPSIPRRCEVVRRF